MRHCSCGEWKWIEKKWRSEKIIWEPVNDWHTLTCSTCGCTIASNARTFPSPKPTINEPYQKIQKELNHIFKTKNKDYGNTFAKFGVAGILIRLSDKIDRAINITNNQITVNHESLRDNMLDIANYATLAVMLIDEKQYSLKTNQEYKGV